MMLSLDTAYRSFGGEVEASNTPTICRLPDSRRHQLSAIARVEPLRMLLDTGATTCLISEAIAARIVRDGYGVWQEAGRFKMADGTFRTLRTLLIEEVRIGQHTIRDV